MGYRPIKTVLFEKWLKSKGLDTKERKAVMMFGIT